ncbi:MAG: membrane protein insertase YidC [Endomicrobiaceae bacterium]
MQKNTVMFVVFSTLFLMLWYVFFQPKPAQQLMLQQNKSESQNINAVQLSPDDKKEEKTIKKSVQAPVKEIEEQDVTVEGNDYKVVFSNKGASVRNWFIREKNGSFVDLVLPETAPILGNFPGSVYEITEQTENKVVFSYVSRENWKIVKTYSLSGNHLHKLDIQLEKLKEDAKLPEIELNWGPGLGTDIKELRENVSVTRVLGYTSSMPAKLEKIKTENNPAQLYKWVAIDNRYFLAAFMPSNALNFANVGMARQSKKTAPMLLLSANVKQNTDIQNFSLQFYVGPKSYSSLKTFNIGLEKTVDFGFFGWLGKIAMSVLFFLFGITGNYGWSIIIMTVIIQILVLPLTLKSFRATAAMKKIQPVIKDLQTKYKNDPKRLQAEMINLYRTQKVNPLGGCLPLLLQLPIFWALFTTLRNAYELRHAEWLLWVKDLSASDSLMHIGGISVNMLPLIMGLGMFLQQKMTAATSDPMQKRMMYIMPIVFTFMFWGFPSGLVLYWLTNSIVSMIVQYFVLRQDGKKI